MLLHTLNENNFAPTAEPMASASLSLTTRIDQEDTQKMDNEKDTLVDFYITDSAYRSLSVIRSWASVILTGMGVIVALEFLSMVLLMVVSFKMQQFNGTFLFKTLQSGAFMALNSWTAFILFKYVKNLGRALKNNDNPALADAFRYQTLFFKWVVITMVAKVAGQLLEALVGQ